MKLSNTVLVSAFAGAIVLLSAFIFFAFGGDNTETNQATTASQAQNASPATEEEGAKNSFQFDEGYIKKAKEEQERLEKEALAEYNQSAENSATLLEQHNENMDKAIAEANKQLTKPKTQPAVEQVEQNITKDIPVQQIKEIEANKTNMDLKTDHIQPKPADVSLVVTNYSDMAAVLRPLKKDITLYPDRTFKYKAEIYQVGDIFLDKYPVIDIDNISIRFKDTDWAYSLRFTGDKK